MASHCSFMKFPLRIFFIEFSIFWPQSNRRAMSCYAMSFTQAIQNGFFHFILLQSLNEHTTYAFTMQTRTHINSVSLLCEMDGTQTQWSAWQKHRNIEVASHHVAINVSHRRTSDAFGVPRWIDCHSLYIYWRILMRNVQSLTSCVFASHHHRHHHRPTDRPIRNWFSSLLHPNVTWRWTFGEIILMKTTISSMRRTHTQSIEWHVRIVI